MKNSTKSLKKWEMSEKLEKPNNSDILYCENDQKRIKMIKKE